MTQRRPHSLSKYSVFFLVLGVELLALLMPMPASADTLSLNSIADAYVQSGAPNANNGSEIIMNGLNDTRDGVVRFDLSSIPSGSTLTSATLRLVATAVGSDASVKNYGARRILVDWVEGTVTWNLPGSTSGTHVATSATQIIAISTAGTYTWNVTSDVASFLNGSTTNYGWRMIWSSNTSGTNKSVDFGTKENVTASNRPVLSVTYTPPIQTPSSNQSSIGAINVVKIVVNDNGGTRDVSSFPLFVNGVAVVSGKTNLFAAPAPVYTISETGDMNYVRSFSGDCDFNGQLNLNPGQNKFCVITNDDVGISASAQPGAPLLEVLRVPVPLSLPDGPGPLTYTYTLRNRGVVPITTVNLSDDDCELVERLSGDLNNDSKIDVSEVWTYACSTIIHETSTGTVTATGWANGMSAIDIAISTVVVGAPKFPDAGVPSEAGAVPPMIHVIKVPSPPALSDGGGAVNYAYSVTNPGNVALTNVSLDDDRCRPIRSLSGDMNSDQKLDIAETWTYTCQTDLFETTTNTVVAHGEANGFFASDFAVVTVVVSARSDHSDIRTVATNLAVGSTGSDVRIMQQFLINENKGPAARALGSHGATQNFGVLTKAALVEWQHAVGIAPATGRFGPASRGYIDGGGNFPIPGFPDTGAPASLSVDPPIKAITENYIEGSTGDSIRTIQQFLISEDKGKAARALGFHGTTRYFGPLTKAALVEWQEAVGIAPATGRFGPASRGHIRSGDE